jgi:hypothetical protein
MQALLRLLNKINILVIVSMLMKNGGRSFVIAPPDYPGKKYRGRYCYEHHLVIWNKEKRLLLDDEIVHHKNNDKIDNRYENLIVCKRTEHNKYHPQKRTRLLTVLVVE